MKNHRYNIKFPATTPHQLSQDEAFFYLSEEGHEIQLRFHDYGDLYKRPGLYEQIFYERLKCQSPKKIAQLLKSVTLSDSFYLPMSELRVLDIGAGNGIMGEELAKYGVARLVGIDIIPEAMEACNRDRPGLYDDYHVMDLTQMSDKVKEELLTWNFDCLTTVAALGFGDMPPAAFFEAFNLVKVHSWIAFNIKETFLQDDSQSEFSSFIKKLILTNYLEIHHLERYLHRISIDGAPLYYYAVVGKKTADLPQDILDL